MFSIIIIHRAQRQRCLQLELSVPCGMMKCFMHWALQRASFIFLWMFAALSTKFVHVQQQKQKKKIKRSQAQRWRIAIYTCLCAVAAAADGLVIVPSIIVTVCAAISIRRSLSRAAPQPAPFICFAATNEINRTHQHNSQRLAHGQNLTGDHRRPTPDLYATAGSINFTSPAAVTTTFFLLKPVQRLPGFIFLRGRIFRFNLVLGFEGRCWEAISALCECNFIASQWAWRASDMQSCLA